MTHGARQAFVGVGANLGDRDATLRNAVERLRAVPGVLAVEVSGVYETEPVGYTDQPRFLNLVAGIETSLGPEELLLALQGIEADFGRERTIRWGPRTLDLDLLMHEGETRTTSELTLPHPRMFERAFVVVPLRELLQYERFSRPAWDWLRERVSAPLPDERDVRRCQPGG